MTHRRDESLRYAPASPHDPINHNYYQANHQAPHQATLQTDQKDVPCMLFEVGSSPQQFLS